jgi:hypothetical protein
MNSTGPTEFFLISLAILQATRSVVFTAYPLEAHLHRLVARSKIKRSAWDGTRVHAASDTSFRRGMAKVTSTMQNADE